MARTLYEDDSGYFLSVGVDDTAFVTSSVDLMIESGSYQVMGMDASDGSVSVNVMLGGVLNLHIPWMFLAICVYQEMLIGINPQSVDGITNSLSVSGNIYVLNDVSANAFVGDGSLTSVSVGGMRSALSSESFSDSVVLVSANGYVGVGTATDNVDVLLHVGANQEVQLRLQDEEQTVYTDFQSADKFEISVINSAQFDSDIIYSLIVGDSNTSAMDVFNIDSDGNVGIGMDPVDVSGLSSSLIVSGNVSANAYLGEGSFLTGVQLDSDQTISTANFNSVSLSNALDLNPNTSLISCGTGEITLQGYYDGSVYDICGCTGGTFYSVLGTTTCGN